MIIRMKTWGAAITLALASTMAVPVSARSPAKSTAGTLDSPAVPVSARSPAGMLVSPMAIPMARFDGLILEQAGGDATRAQVMKEQWMAMYNSLTPTVQSAIDWQLRAADARGFLQIVRQDLPGALAKQSWGLLSQTLASNGNARKLAAADDNEYVFVPSAPCRVSDTRIWGLGGILPGITRQFWGWSVVNGWDWSEAGGTGIAGTGDCSSTYFVAGEPVAAMITVVAIAGTAPGHLRAWNGGGTTLPATSMINFGPGNVIANTTIIPMNRVIAAYSPSDNAKRDFALYNGSAGGGAVHVIADVVGYFIKPQGYVLTCTTVNGTPLTSTTLGFKSATAPACPVGAARTGVLCALSASTGADLQSSGFGGGPFCEWEQTSTVSNTFTARSICCTLP